MIKSTLCYIERNGQFLMLYRNKKKHDPNAGKWLGIGGKFEEGETPDECMLREVKEETGLSPSSYHFLGVIEFRNDTWEDEDMYLYTAQAPAEFEPSGCNEGDLKWIDLGEVLSLKLWEGDRYFLKPLIEGSDSINLRLIYSGDNLLKVEEL